MGNKAIISACDTGLFQVNGVWKYGANCRISYLPTNFDLSGVFVEVNPEETVSAINNVIQQFGMDTINIEVPGAITSRDDVRLQGGFVK